VKVLTCSTPPPLDFQVLVIGKALLIKTLDSATMNGVALVTSSAVGLERNALDGCCGLPSGHNNGLAQQALVVAGNQPASLCSEPPQAGIANAYLPSVAFAGSSEGGSLLALTPPHPPHQILVNLETFRNCVLLDIQLVKLLGILLLGNLWPVYGNAMSL